ncbi:hypothetical protein [Xanthomonas arboricola]|uniref:hypothetical protein n=1 Tax=Xanthomonas arboricola TaxID=56448 RepID=UPI001EE6A131|nr:hypothetical protein [Xanthomonas arboricola]
MELAPAIADPGGSGNRCATPAAAVPPRVDACAGRLDDRPAPHVAAPAPPPAAGLVGWPLLALLLVPYDRYAQRDVGNVPMHWLLTARHTE